MGTFTPNKGYSLPAVGADVGIWGTELNTGTTIMDTNMGGVTTVNCAGSSNVMATQAQAQNLIHNLTGVLTGNISYLLPQTGGFYYIENNTTGISGTGFNYVVTIQTTAFGSGVTVPQGMTRLVFSDGTNITSNLTPGWQTLAALSFSGQSSVVLAMPTNYSAFRMSYYVSGSVANVAPIQQPCMRFSVTGIGGPYINISNYIHSLTEVNGAAFAYASPIDNKLQFATGCSVSSFSGGNINLLVVGNSLFWNSSTFGYDVNSLNTSNLNGVGTAGMGSGSIINALVIAPFVGGVPTGTLTGQLFFEGLLPA